MSWRDQFTGAWVRRGELEWKEQELETKEIRSGKRTEEERKVGVY